MPKNFDSSKPFGNRKEYQEQSIGDRIEECQVITDVLDDLLHATHDSGGTTASAAHSSKDGISQFRSFQYLDSDVGGGFGYSWPLVEKTIDVRYIQAKGKLHSEQYQIAVATRVHQVGAAEELLLNIYQIHYYGDDRQSVATAIDERDGTDAGEPVYSTRTMTPYDHTVIFSELSHLMDMLSAQERENSYISTLS